MAKVPRDKQFYRFSLYGFLKNLRFFEPFILLIFRSYGLSYFQIGVLYAVRDISTNILEVPAGIISDSFGRKRAMISAFSAYLVSFLVIYFLNDYPFLILAMIIFALGEAFRTGTHKALILEYLKIKGISELKVAYYGLTRSASQLGSALNSLIAAGLVFFTGSYRIMFLASTIPYLLDLINLAGYPPELDGEIEGVEPGGFSKRVKETVDGFLAVFRDGSVLRVVLNSSAFRAFFKATRDYLQPILASLALGAAILGGLEDTQRSALIIGAVYFLIYLLNSLASRQAFSFSSRFSNLCEAVNLSYLAGGVLLLIAGLSAAFELQILAVISFILIYILMNIRRPINVGLISDRIPSRIMASGLSVESQLATLLSALAAPLLGYLADVLGVGQAIAITAVLLVGLYSLARVE